MPELITLVWDCHSIRTTAVYFSSVPEVSLCSASWKIRCTERLRCPQVIQRINIQISKNIMCRLPIVKTDKRENEARYFQQGIFSKVTKSGGQNALLLKPSWWSMKPCGPKEHCDHNFTELCPLEIKADFEDSYLQNLSEMHVIHMFSVRHCHCGLLP